MRSLVSQSFRVIRGQVNVADSDAKPSHRTRDGLIERATEAGAVFRHLVRGDLGNALFQQRPVARRLGVVVDRNQASTAGEQHNEVNSAHGAKV